jgi:putative ABC transport system permease protein
MPSALVELVLAFASDLRHAFRLLRKSPAATTISLALLALGTGANAAVFTLVNTLYFKPLPVPDAARVVHVYSMRRGLPYNVGFSADEYRSLSERGTNAPPLAAVRAIANVHLVSPRGVHELGGAFVTDNYFAVLGIAAARGRLIQPDPSLSPEQRNRAVISQRLWRTYFAGDPSVLGERLTIDGLPVTIAGIAPNGFDGDEPGVNTEIWLPIAMLGPAGFACEATPCASLDELVGRLPPGRTLESARAEWNASVRWSHYESDRMNHRELLVAPAIGSAPDTRSELRSQMQLLSGITATLLVIICVNLAGLTLARGTGRAREIAVRLALGASRARVIRQLMAESLVLAGLGAALGLLVSVWTTGLLSAFYVANSEGFVQIFDFSIDARVVTYTMALSLVTAILFGLAPSIHVSRQDLMPHLQGSRSVNGTPRIRGLRATLVAVQVALSLVLVVSSGLLVRSGRTLLQGTNFEPDHVAVMRLRPELAQYTPEQAAQFFARAKTALAATPGVQSVTMVIGGEGLVWNNANGRQLDLLAPAERTSALAVNTQDVDGGYFDTLRIPLRSGRVFTDHDAAGTAPVAIVNDALARQLWNGGDAIGRTIVIDREPYSVVGVAANMQPSAAMGASPHLYLPFWQAGPGKVADVRFAIRVAGDPASMLPALRAAVRTLDPNVPLAEDMPLTTQIALHYAPVLLARAVMGFCSLLAVCLSAIGLYSVIALAVRARTREIGVRMALGASPRNVVRVFLDQALMLAAAGIIGGLGLAWVATRLLQAWLYGVAAHDPATFAGGAGLVLATAIVAGYLPARRAARLDPIAALRHD